MSNQSHVVDVRVVTETEYEWDSKEGGYDRSRPIGEKCIVDQHGLRGREFMIGCPIGRGRTETTAINDFLSVCMTEYNYHERQRDPEHVNVTLTANVLAREDRRDPAPLKVTKIADTLESAITDQVTDAISDMIPKQLADRMNADDGLSDEVMDKLHDAMVGGCLAMAMKIKDVLDIHMK